MNGMAASEKIFELLDTEEPSKGTQPFPAENHAIVLKDVCFSYEPEREILHGVNMAFGQGQFTAIVGEVRQYVDPSIRRARPKWFKKVGFIYQNPNYQLFMTQVADEVGYKSESAENTEHYLSAFSLGELRDRHPQSLSEGQKLRLSIAAVAAENPEVLILDEPTVG